MFFSPLIIYRKLKEKLRERVILKKYSAFFPIKRVFERAYARHNPYQLCHQYFKSKGYEDPYVYGETPLWIFEKVASFLKLTEKDTFLDLGCGRGKGLFFLQSSYQLKCIGCEVVSEFVKIGNKIASELGTKEVIFLEKDLVKDSFPDADVVYIAGTCMPDEVIKNIIDNLTKKNGEVKIVSVSFPLSEYNTGFKVFHTMEVEFLWGKTTLYFEKYHN